jgi:RecA-family ATPase
VNKKADREKLWQLRSMAIDLKEDGATFAEIESVLARVVAKEGFDPPLARKTALDFGQRHPRPKIGKRASDIRPRQITWLWQSYIPRAKVIVIDGDPGKGKSLITIDIAARLSTGRSFPDDAPCAVGRAILVNMDDAADDTTVPRLIAAGADLNRIVLLDSIDSIMKVNGVPTQINPLELPLHLEYVTQLVRDEKADLLVIDPLLSCLSSTIDSYKFQSVAKVMIKLKALAEQTKIAIIVVRHLTKASDSSSAIHRGMGSMSILGTTRQGFMVCVHPENPDVRVLARTKGNLTKNILSWTYTINENFEKGCLT